MLLVNDHKKKFDCPIKYNRLESVDISIYAGLVPVARKVGARMKCQQTLAKVRETGEKYHSTKRIAAEVSIS